MAMVKVEESLDDDIILKIYYYPYFHPREEEGKYDDVSIVMEKLDSRAKHSILDTMRDSR